MGLSAALGRGTIGIDSSVVISEFERALTGNNGPILIDVDRDQRRTAAQLRARRGVRTPDALQLAAALSVGCSAFVTNDRKIPSVPGLPVVQLPDATG